MSQFFSVTSPEFWSEIVPAPFYETFYYSDGWRGSFSPRAWFIPNRGYYSEYPDPYTYEYTYYGGNSFWTEYATSRVLSVKAAGVNIWGGYAVYNIGLKVRTRISDVDPSSATPSEAIVTFSDETILLEDIVSIFLSHSGNDYSYANVVSSIVVELDTSQPRWRNHRRTVELL